MHHLHYDFGKAFSCFNWLFFILVPLTLVFICLYLSLYCKLIFMTINLSYVRLPWFRVHIVVLNDVGRLLSVHFMHSALFCGWSFSMTLFELIVLDPSDPIFNPIWRQGACVLPFVARLGVTSSVYPLVSWRSNS